jgi:hypothetical protein
MASRLHFGMGVSRPEATELQEPEKIELLSRSLFRKSSGATRRSDHEKVI